MMVPKAVDGALLTEDDKQLAEKEGNHISVNERSALIAKAKELGFGDRAVVVRSNMPQEWQRNNCDNWGFCKGFSYTTGDKIIEVQWVTNIKNNYRIDELSVIHKYMGYGDVAKILNPVSEPVEPWGYGI
jgi:hypothetical protein